MSDQPSKLVFVVPAVTAALAVGGIATQAYSHAACIDDTERAELSLQSVEVDGEPVENPEPRNYVMYLQALHNDPDYIRVRAMKNGTTEFSQVLEDKSDQ